MYMPPSYHISTGRSIASQLHRGATCRRIHVGGGAAMRSAISSNSAATLLPVLADVSMYSMSLLQPGGGARAGLRPGGRKGVRRA